MKKIIKYLFIGITIVLIAKTMIQKIFDNRLIKFESYNTGNELRKDVNQILQIGKHINDAIEIIEQSGAKCIIEPSDESIYPFKYPGAKYITTCYYRAYFFSWDPVIDYSIILQSDENHVIVHLSASRTGGFGVI